MGYGFYRHAKKIRPEEHAKISFHTKTLGRVVPLYSCLTLLNKYKHESIYVNLKCDSLNSWSDSGILVPIKNLGVDKSFHHASVYFMGMFRTKVVAIVNIRLACEISIHCCTRTNANSAHVGQNANYSRPISFSRWNMNNDIMALYGTDGTLGRIPIFIASHSFVFLKTFFCFIFIL